jgi:transposase
MDCITEEKFSAFVGLDWANGKHDVCVQGASSDQRESSQFAHRPDAIDQWAMSLHARFGGMIAVTLELTKGPIVYALQKYDFIVLFPLNPKSLARYREAFHPSGAKNDPTDAELALDLLLRHRDKFKPLQPQSAAMRTLICLVEQRRRFVGDAVRYTNRLVAALMQYFPQALEWFPRRDSMLFCDFLIRWPTLKQVKHARKANLEAFFNAHNMRGAERKSELIAAIRQATPLTNDDAVITAYKSVVLALVSPLRATLQVLGGMDKQIAELAPTLPDYALFSALPGAGAALAPRLVVAFGEQRERFQTAAEFQRYAGIAPVIEASGKTRWVHWRWQCPKFLRQTMIEWSAQTINRSYWAGIYYRQQRGKGSSHQAALRALAFKWIRILFRCWQTHTPYDESVYLNALRQRGSPLPNAATKP